MFAVTALVPIIAIVAPAQAGPKDEAEHIRLAEEMRNLASRNAWRGVEAKYTEMLELEKKGVQLTYDDHMLGAQAARDLGRITEVYERLSRAKDVKATKEVLDWMSDIDANYGRVELVKDDRYVGDTRLVANELPFAPDQRAAIGAATGVVAETGGYVGLLPFGGYTYGGKPFEVTKGSGQVPRVTLAPEQTAKRDGPRAAKRRDGFRVDLGPLYTAVGSSSGPGVHPEPYDGFGIRGGLGFELELTKRIGLVAQAGYHGMLGGKVEGSTSTSDLQTNPMVDPNKDSLSLFYVTAGPAIWFGDLSVSLGASWAGGSASSTGLVADCSDASAPGCGTVSDGASDAVKAASPVNGQFVKTGGGVLGLYYGFMDFPGMKKARLGVSLYGGAQYDLATLYPWGQLAITIAPGI